MRALDTQIRLPPGPLTRAVVREVLRLVFDEFHWFVPRRYGDAFLDNRIPTAHDGFEALLGLYEERKHLFVAASTDRDFIAIQPSWTGAEHPYTGSVSWTTREQSSYNPEWRAAHETQIAHLMRLLGAPLAYSALWDDIRRKKERIISRDVGSELVSTVRDYSQGLTGLYWRNFFGPPFVRMFGDRLQSLPVEYRRELGDGIVLVEPYPLPGDAETETSAARERELIEHLGRECFYDHDRHTLPTRRPELPPPGAPV